MLSSYINFIFREPTSSLESVFDMRDDLITSSLISCVFFSSICLFSVKLLDTFFPKLLSKVPESKRKELPVYIASLFHHIIIVPYGMYHIYLDLHRGPEEYLVHNYSLSESSIIPFCFGYIFADTVFFAIGAAIQGKPDFFIHHLLSFGLFYVASVCPGYISRYIPHLIICESSALFFNTAWICRNILGMRGNSFVTALELLFVLFFFLTRIVNLPVIVWRALDIASPDLLFLGRIIFYPTIFLQYFWFSKMLGGLTSRFSQKDETAAAKTK